MSVASMAPVGGSQGFEIAVNRIRINDGKVTLDDQSEKVSIAATGITASVDADFSGDEITGKADVSFDVEQQGGTGRVEIAAGNIQAPKKAGADAIDKTTASGTIKLSGIDIGEAIATSAPEFGTRPGHGGFDARGRLQPVGRHGDSQGHKRRDKEPPTRQGSGDGE